MQGIDKTKILIEIKTKFSQTWTGKARFIIFFCQKRKRNQFLLDKFSTAFQPVQQLFGLSWSGYLSDRGRCMFENLQMQKCG